ncbi:MAG TPA: zf-HC2 domain-containing protein [Pirellulales bacterium]|jgi:hypothetical protein
MRCEEVLDQLPVLAYNELDEESAVRCHEHLAGCAACQAEWLATRRALQHLDSAPRHQTQVDLAAVCLRMARQQRRGRLPRRWGMSLAAAAAIFAAFAATRLLAIDFEPGRLIVAWNAKEAGEPNDRRPVDPASVDRVESPIVGDPGAGQTTFPGMGQPADATVSPSDLQPVTNRNSSASALALILEGDQSLAWRRLRESRSMDDPTASIFNGTPAIPGGDRPVTPVSYSDLRRQWIEDQQISRSRPAAPGA